MIYSLQAYRGLAALFVVLVHTSSAVQGYFLPNNFTNFFQFGGHLGVDFFFVLSGFIIYYIHSKDIGMGFYYAVIYLKKRILRIIPIYWFLTLFLLPLLLIVPGATTPYMHELSSLAKSLFLMPQEHYPNIRAAWTLVQEFLFYFIFFIVILNKRIGILVLIVWFMGIIYFNSDSVLIGDNYKTNLYLRYFFQIENLLFFFGIASAFFMFKFSKFFENNISLFVFGNLILILTSLFYLYTNIQFYVLLYGLGAFCIIINSKNTILEKYFKKKKILLVLGNASFSIYLIHYIFISFFMKIFKYLNIDNILSSSVIFIVIATLAVLGGILFYEIVEKKLNIFFKDYKKRLN